MLKTLIATVAALLVTSAAATAQPQFELAPIASFDRPWAVAVLPQGGFLVTEKPGRLVYVSAQGEVQTIAGAPKVRAKGQVGLHDVALAPDFTTSKTIYLSWVDGSNGGALHLGRGRLDLAELRLVDLQVIWRAAPRAAMGILAR